MTIPSPAGLNINTVVVVHHALHLPFTFCMSVSSFVAICEELLFVMSIYATHLTLFSTSLFDFGVLKFPHSCFFSEWILATDLNV